MSGCNHNHGKSDGWTNFSAIGEAVSSFVSDAYWLSTCFDIVSGFGENAIGLSYYAIGFGAFIALLSAGGAAYCHRNLNTVHQHKHDDESLPLNHKDHSAEQELTVLQKIALVGDFISHTGDIAGPLTFVASLATHGKAPRWGKGLAQLGATLFGGFSSVANVRTCANAMLGKRS